MYANVFKPPFPIYPLNSHVCFNILFHAVLVIDFDLKLYKPPLHLKTPVCIFLLLTLLTGPRADHHPLVSARSVSALIHISAGLAQERRLAQAGGLERTSFCESAPKRWLWCQSFEVWHHLTMYQLHKCQNVFAACWLLAALSEILVLGLSALKILN